MKKYSRILIISLLLTLIFVGCSKKETCTITEKEGVKYYSNRNVPANPNLKLVIDNKLEIIGNAEDSLLSFSQASDIEIDEDGNFYILDGRAQTIHKYDKNGKYLLNFCRKGNGPGEINGAHDIAVVGDSITISSPGQKRVSIFDKDGNYGRHKTVLIPGLYYGVIDVGIGPDEVLGFLPTFKADEEKVTIGNKLIIKNKVHDTKVLLHEIPAVYEPTDVEGSKIIFMPFAFYEDNIYYPTNFPVNYLINIKDRKGNLKGVISKHARRIELNPEEKKHYEETAGFVWNGERIIPNCKFKAVMNKINTDKFGQLLVWVSQQRKEGVKHNPSIDVFKDGAFQNTVILDVVNIVETHTFTDASFSFKRDKLIVYDVPENTFSIYDYHYEGM
ncbi:MAG: hypothetical protein KAS62_02740 [Candidatus Delongbacteria bacterium]|nr:hypothetical protein [Candidatus Delongbacteria bacterium]